MAASKASHVAGDPTDDRWSRVKAIFLDALDHAEADRAAFVATACAGDDALAREARTLLESDQAAGRFCDTPAAALLGSESFAALASMPRLEPGRRLGVYEITGWLGAGGMGEVYRARDPRLRRDVAIKTIPADADHGDAARRLVKEARHIASLRHPNICTILEVGESTGVPFIVMEYVDGRTLSALQKEAMAPLEDALRYSIQIAEALDHAHGRGIVHRDLKSSNVVIERGGRVILLDFGLARRLPPNAEATESWTAGEGGPAGTLTHMAPEILSGGGGDARSDIWSMGVLLYQLVTGQLPFSGRTAFETSSAILGDLPAPMDRRIPLALRLVIERCLAKNPDERYQRASDVRTALEQILHQRGWRSWQIAARLIVSRRRRTLQVSTSAAAAMALLGVGVAQWRPPADVPRSPVASLAVLPLGHRAGNAGDDVYASGMTDALIAQLGAAGQLRVTSRASAVRASAGGKAMAAIGRELGVDALVQGTLRRSADRVRLDLRLLDVARDQVLWSDTFERSARDVLVLQADAVRAVAAAVRAALRPGARDRLALVPVIRPDVYEAYLKGRYEWNRRTPASLQLAIQHFTRAIDLDPTYAPAHAALADCYSQLGTVMVGTGSPREHRPRAAAAAIKALQIDPASSEAHAALGYVRHYQWQWAEAEREFLRAIDLNPSNSLARLWYANLLMSRRRFDEALRQGYAARDLDPFSPIVNTNIGWILTFAGRHEAAIDHLTRTVAIDPDYPQARWRLADALAVAGRYDASLIQVEEALRMTNRSASSLALLAIVHARMGRPDQAHAVLGELLARAQHEYVPPSAIAAVYGTLGEIDTALGWIERSYEEGANSVAYLTVDHWNQPLRVHPRFRSILQRTGQQ